jgi:YVTN family beta-propeller protein
MDSIIRPNQSKRRRATITYLAVACLTVGLVAVSAAILPAQEAGAATDVVTNCSGSASVAGSLPYELANASSGDTVTFALSPSCSLITLSSTIDITKNLTITGPGASSLAVSGGGSFQDFSVGGTDTISGLTIEDGFDQYNNGGGGIFNYGDLTVTDSVVSGNATHFAGGGIYSNGTLTVTDSTVSGNSAADNAAGAGIYTTGTLTTISDSTVSDNTASSAGGGIDIYSTGTLAVTDSTVSGNSASDGAGIYSNGTLATVSDSTVSDNAASQDGGGIDSVGTASLTVTDSTFSLNSATSDGGAVDNADNGGSGTATITSSTFSENYASTDGGSIDNGDNGGTGTTNLGATILSGAPTGGECSGTVTDEGYNIDDDSSCGLTAPSSTSDLPNLDVTLGALKQNQGPTQTILPDSDSPAVGVIPNNTTIGATQVCPTTDQQGVASPPGGSCNIGATQTTLTAPTISAVTFAGTPASPTVTVWGSGFGTEADLGAPVPAYDNQTGSDYGQQLYLLDGFGAGEGDGPFGDDVGVSISSYSDDQITFAFGSAYPSYGEVDPGDNFSVTVLGTIFNGTVSYPAHVQAGPAPYAYVANFDSGTVTPISTATNTADTPITVGSGPYNIAITPNGQTAYVTNVSSASVTPITTATNTAGTAIPMASDPGAIAITPNGATAYVATTGNTVIPITTATNAAGTPITVGTAPSAIAITPNGQTALVANSGDGTVTPISVANNSAGTPITVGSTPEAIAITPDGQTAYVVDQDDSVIPIDLNTDTAEAAIGVGSGPGSIAITPDGTTAYVGYLSSGTVTPIDLSTDTVGSPISAGDGPEAVAISPDGQTAYVADSEGGTVTPIATSSGTPGNPISVGTNPSDVAVMPDQGPTASLTAATSGSTTTFGATDSVPGTSPIVNYAWNFGDGSPVVDTLTPTTTHSYATGVCAGTVPSPSCDATVTETDADGTSTTQVTTGQTVSLDGSGAATASTTVTIAVADCTTDNTCQAAVTTAGTPMTPPQAVTVAVPAAGSQTGTLTVTSGAGQLNCSPKGFKVSSAITSYSASFTPVGNVDVSDLITGPTKTKGIQICFEGATPTPSYLKMCAKTPVAPCATLAVVPTGVQATILVPGSDPRFRINGVQTLTENPKSVGAKGTIGKTLAISGSDLLSSTGQTRPTVSFTSLSGSTIAGAVTTATATKLAVVVPNGAATGPVSIAWPDEVLTSDGSIVIGPPTVSSIKPATGSPNGGTSVTVTGTGFTGATAVKFGTTEATSFVVNSATSLTAVSPEGTGTVDVTVTTKGGASAKVTAEQFTYS